MKKIFFISFLTLIIEHASSQTPIKEGPSIELAKGAAISKVVGGDDKSFYAILVKGKGGESYLEKYSTATLTTEFSIPLPSEKKDLYIAGLFDGEKVFLFRTNEKSRVMDLYVDIVKKDGTFFQQGILMKTIYVDWHIGAPNNVQVVMSPNNKSVAVIILDNTETFEYRKVEATVYDTKTFKKKFSKSISGATVGSVKLDDNESLYYLHGGDLNIVKKDAAKEEIYPLIEKGQSLESAKIDLNGENIVVAGFQKSETSVYSIFTKTINTNTKETVSDFKTFPSNLNKMLYCFNPPDGSRDFHITAVELTKTANGYYLMGEEGAKFVLSSDNAGGNINGNSTKTQNEYYNTIVVKISTEKKIEWIKPLPKAIYTYDMFNIGSKHFLSFVKDEELKVIHLQHPLSKGINIDNYNISDLKKVMGSNACDAILYHVSKTGDVKSEVLIEKIDNGFEIQPCVADDKYFTDNIFYSNKNSNIIYFSKGKNTKFASIELK